DGIWSLPEFLRVVPLRADRLRKWAAPVLALHQPLDCVPEVVSGLPPELDSCALVDVHAIDLRGHPPAQSRIDLLELRNVPSDNRSRTGSERRQIFLLERRRGTDDEFPK